MVSAWLKPGAGGWWGTGNGVLVGWVQRFNWAEEKVLRMDVVVVTQQSEYI